MKNNKLIAEFMGANPFRESVNEDVLSYEIHGLIESIEDGVYEKHFFLPSEMKFHTSWDWLMPVAEKCLTTDENTDGQHYFINDSLLTCNIEEVYDRVVGFINEHNKKA